MSDQTNRIVVLLEEYASVIRARARFNALEKELLYQSTRLSDLAKIVEQEHLDVVRLEQVSLRSLFVSILRNEDEQLEKERQEYLLASMQYAECKNLIRELEYEKQILIDKLSDSEVILQELDKELKNVSAKGREEEIQLLEELKDINQDIKNIYKLRVESKEAVDIAKDLSHHFTSMTDYLNEAKSYSNWGKFYAEKKQVRALNQAFIDKAHSELYIIQRLLTFLFDEIEDVEEAHQLFKRSEVIIRHFNIAYYKSLIADWIATSNLKEALTSTMAAHKVISGLIQSLERLIKTSSEELDICLKRRDRIVLKIADGDD